MEISKNVIPKKYSATHVKKLLLTKIVTYGKNEIANNNNVFAHNTRPLILLTTWKVLCKLCQVIAKTKNETA